MDIEDTDNFLPLHKKEIYVLSLSTEPSEFHTSLMYQRIMFIYREKKTNLINCHSSLYKNLINRYSSLYWYQQSSNNHYNRDEQV